MTTSQHDEKPETETPKGPLQQVFAWLAMLHAVLILVQPILAGMSLQGSGPALDMHYSLAMAIMTVAVAQILAALLWWKLRGGPAQAVGLSVFLLVLEMAQFMLGLAGAYAVHLPLGIITLLGAFMVASMGFRGQTRRQARAAQAAMTEK